jgi:hypothetical protein
MWLVNLETNEEGWHSKQLDQKEPCDYLVFVKDGGCWKTKLWDCRKIKLRAKDHDEAMNDVENMKSIGFLFI